MTTPTALYALYSRSPNSVVHRIPASVKDFPIALCGFAVFEIGRHGWHSIAAAPRELPGQHRECRVCAARAKRLAA